jgi:hypothetical protein
VDIDLVLKAANGTVLLAYEADGRYEGVNWGATQGFADAGMLMNFCTDACTNSMTHSYYSSYGMPRVPVTFTGDSSLRSEYVFIDAATEPLSLYVDGLAPGSGTVQFMYDCPASCNHCTAVAPPPSTPCADDSCPGNAVCAGSTNECMCETGYIGSHSVQTGELTTCTPTYSPPPPPPPPPPSPWGNLQCYNSAQCNNNAICAASVNQCVCKNGYTASYSAQTGELTCTSSSPPSPPPSPPPPPPSPSGTMQSPSGKG